MHRWLTFLAFAGLLIMALVSCTPKARIPLNSEGIITQTVYVDEAFTFDEYIVIKSAADEWKYVSRGVVQFNLIYPYHPSSHTFVGLIDRNIMFKTTASSPFVIKTDKEIETDNKKKGIYETRLTLGFWQLTDVKTNRWFIGLVTDRIVTSYKLRIVAIHEFGHAVKLQHTDNAVGIMNSSASFESGCLNRYDAMNFAELYGYKIDMLNFCLEK